MPGISCVMTGNRSPLSFVLAMAALTAAVDGRQRQYDQGRRDLEPMCNSSGAYLSNWMGCSSQIIGDQSLLSLSLPGSHDSLTYDLSERVADNSNDIPPAIARLLHDVAPKEIIGKFIRDNAVTQGLNVTEQLNGGLRFLDMRLVFSQPPVGLGGRYQWYGLHFMQTVEPLRVYFSQVREWLDRHPTEIVVMWLSHHGGACKTGTQAYPGASPRQKQQFFSQILEIFDGLVLDRSSGGRLNSTTYTEMIARDNRVVFYAIDWVEFTGNSSLAYDACIYLDNKGGNNVISDISEQKSIFRRSSSTKAKLLAADKFYLVQFGGLQLAQQIESAALLRFQPFDHSHIRKQCAAAFGIPNSTFCPLTLLGSTQLCQYYYQRVFDWAYTEGMQFPTAIYLNAVDTEGTIRTGTASVSNLVSSVTGAPTHHSTKFAYAATMIGSSINQLCKESATSQLQSECSRAKKFIDELRSKYPMKTWTSTQLGRIVNWPSI